MIVNELRRLIAAQARGKNDLSDLISELSAEEWRAVLLAAAHHRCIACGEDTECTCPDRVDEAKEMIWRRSAQ